MALKVSQPEALTRTVVKLQIEAQLLHFGDEIVVGNSPLPNIVNVTVDSLMLRVNLVHFFED